MLLTLELRASCFLAPAFFRRVLHLIDRSRGSCTAPWPAIRRQTLDDGVLPAGRCRLRRIVLVEAQLVLAALGAAFVRGGLDRPRPRRLLRSAPA